MHGTQGTNENEPERELDDKLMMPHAQRSFPRNSLQHMLFPYLVVVLVVLLSWSMSGLVQAQELLWAKQAGGIGNEEGSGVVDNAGNTYVGGEFEGSATFGSGEPNQTILTSLGLRDAFLAKYDESGNLIWAKRAGGVDDARAGGTIVNGLGHLYSGGEFEGAATFGLGENNQTTLTSAGGPESWFGRFDPTTGDLLWVKKGILSDSPGFGFDNLGNISIAGSFEGMVTFGVGELNETTLTSTGTGDIFIAKLNPNGELIEAKKISGVGQEESRVVIDELDNVYLLSRFVGSLTLGLGEINEIMLTSLGNGDVFLAKFNSKGELVWAKHAGGTGDEGIDGIKIDGAGNSYVIGGFGIAAGAGEMITFRLGEANPIALSSQGSGDVFIAKYDLNGNLLWVKQAGGEGFDDIEGLAVDPLGNAFVLGSFGNIFGSPFGDILGNSITIDHGGGNPTILNSAGLRDLYIAKFDQNGNLLWARSDGGLGDEESADISVDGLGHSYATGFFTGSAIFGSGEVNQTTLPSAGGTDFFIAKFSTSGNFTLDVDGNGVADALTDGMLILRYLFGFKSEGLVNGVLALDATRTTPEEILAYLDSIRDILLDVDGNGNADAFTDGMLIARFLMGFTGDSLVNGVIDPSGNRTSAEAIQGFLSASLPDITAPIISITSPLSGSQVNSDVITVMGIVDDPTATVQINGVLAILSGNSFTVAGVPLVQGENTIQAIATDPSGNTASDSIQVFFLPVTSVIGTVLDPKGTPVFDALVITNTSESSLSGADGTFSITNVQIGIEAIQVQVEIMVNGVTHHGSSQSFTAVANGITDVGAITIVPPGTGTFLAPAHLAAGLGPRKIVTDDLNHDGLLDLAVANSVGKSVSVWQGQGNGLFNNLPNLNFETTLHSLVIEKFDNDDHYDIGVSRAQPGPFGGENSLSDITCVRLGDGGFGFGPETCVPHPSALALEAGDLNRDGSPDAVAGLKALTAISLMLGRPTGLLNSSSNTLVGNGITDDITSLAIKDIDKDGFLDVAVTSQRAQQVNVLWGNGNGGFSGLDLFAAGTLPTAVTVADFNNDNILDLAVANQGSHDVSVLWGDGGRVFLSPTHYPVGTDPVAIVSVDFNNDGFMDVGTANKGSHDVSILLTNPLNGFLPPTHIAVGNAPVSLASGDFNKDGVQDLAVANDGSQNISILLGIPVDLTPPLITLTSPSPGQEVVEGETLLLTADATDDGGIAAVDFLVNDQVVGSTNTSPYVLPFPIALGASSFQVSAIAKDFAGNQQSTATVMVSVLPDTIPPTVSILTPDEGRSVIAGSNLMVTVEAEDNAGVSDVQLFLDSQFVGTVSQPPYEFSIQVPSGNPSLILEAKALDLKGNMGDSGPRTLNVLPSLGGFSAPRDFTAGVFPRSAGLGLFNNDSFVDIAVASSGVGAQPYSINILLGDGQGNFDLGGSAVLSASPKGVLVGDYLEDGFLDVAVGISGTTTTPGDTVSIFAGNGAGGVSGGSEFFVGKFPSPMVTADFNNDQNLDLAVGTAGSDLAGDGPSILLGDGLGNFSDPTKFPSGLRPSGINRDAVLGDFNRDSHLDLAMHFQHDVHIYAGNGNGEFALFDSYRLSGSNGGITGGDFNGDEFVDLAVGSISLNVLSTRLGDGTGLFSSQEPANFETQVQPLSPVTADFNGDGILDLAVLNFGTDVHVLLGAIDGSFTPPIIFPSTSTNGIFSVGLEVGYINQDRYADLVVVNSHDVSILLWEPSDEVLADQTPPIVTPPADVTLSPMNLAGTPKTDFSVATILASATALDDVSGQLRPTHNAPDIFPLGETLVTYTAVDAAGNTGTATSKIILVDMPPTVEIVSPSTGSTVTEGEVLPIIVNAFDDLGVANVNIFVNGQLAANKVIAPFTFDFLIPQGVTELTIAADATDSAGHFTAATNVVVSVLPIPRSTIVGTVIQLENANVVPAVGVEVTTTLGLTGVEGPTAVTSADGTFTISDVNAVVGNITARASVLQNTQLLRGNSGNVVPVPNGITDVGQILLEEVVVPEIFLFTGTFTDGVGAPVPDLSINLFDSLTNRSASGVTDVNGVFTTTLGAGTYTLTAALTPPGSFQFLEVLRVSDLLVTSDTVQNFMPAPVVTLSGIVTDSTLTPIANATVQVCEASSDPFCQIFVGSATTNAQGEYVISVAGDKIYEVSIFLPTNVQAVEERDIEVIVTGDTIKDFVLDMGVQLSGLVRDAQNNPLAGASVNAFDSVNNSFGFGNADALGQYAMNLPPGIFDVTVFGQLEGIPNFVELLRVPDIPVTGNTIQDFTIPELVTVQGTVTSAGLDPVVGATVEVCRLPPPEFFQSPPGASGCFFFGINSAVTDATGGYSMQVPIGMSYDLAVAPIPNTGVLGQTLQGIDVLASTTQDVMLEAGSQVTGIVVDNQGLPVAGLTVAMIHDTENIFHSALTDTNGSYSLTLPDGLFNLEVHGAISEFVNPVSLVQATGIQVAGNLVHDVQLPTAVTLSGIVTDGIGTPLPNARIAVCQITSFLNAGSPSVGECEFFSPVNSATTNFTGFYSMLLPGNLNYVVDVVPEPNTGKIPIQIQTLELVSDTVLDVGL